ncbi:MAG: hypothetical protein Q9167_005673 [Letrouitia subvulpina]
MSTTSRTHSSPPAPWRSLFLDHISTLESPEFIFATLQPSSPSSKDQTPYVPRLRYCIYRGMWSNLPENKHNTAEQNPRVYESDMPTFTTDVRMEKVGQLFASSAGKAGSEEQIQGSGGGGPCEAVWWIKDKGTQWRVKGIAFVIARDIEGRKGQEESSGVRTVKSEIGGSMRVVSGQEGKEGDWSWARELTAHFGNCSPGMRGTWRNPPPGTKVEGDPDQDHQLGQKVTDLNDPIARENFRVVVIKPDEVEQLDISDPSTARRFRFTLNTADPGGNGEWTKEELWP